MLRIMRERLRQGYRTMRFPRGEPPALPERFRGLPVIDQSACRGDCSACIDACPTRAITKGTDGRLRLDLGACIFCGECAAACPTGAITFSRDYRLRHPAARDLVIGDGELRLAQSLGKQIRRVLGRSLRLQAGQRRRVQRVRSGCECAHHNRLGHGEVRNPVRGFPAPR